MKLFILFLLLSFNLSAKQVIRGAFDFGSGKIKIQVAVVDQDTQKIVSTLLVKDIIVKLSEDAAHHPEGMFSEEIQQKALTAAKQLKEEALQLGVEQFSGVATEAYRKAPNGQDLIHRYLSELNIPVRMISQFDEGKLGFLALINETGLDPTKVISWDIGGGSCQIAYFDNESNFKVYMLPFGRETTKNAIIRYVKGQNPEFIRTPNPMTRVEWNAAINYFLRVMPGVPEDLTKKLLLSDVQIVGISAHPEQLRSLKQYQIDHVEKILTGRLNKKDEQIDHKTPALAISELALVYSIMHKLQINDVSYIRTKSGSTSGLLSSKEYWLNY